MLRSHVWAQQGRVMCSVRDSAMGEGERLTAVLDTGFSCCKRVFNDKGNYSACVNNSKN